MEQPVSVENMEEEDYNEEMDQTGSSHSSAPTPVIVSVPTNVDSTSSFTSVSGISPAHSSLFQVVSPDHLQRVHHPLLTKQHLQVRQTLSEPGRNGRGHKAKVARLSPTRLSPVQPRRSDLSKTLSMGAALDTASNSVLWKPVDSSIQRVGVVGGAESMQSEGSEDSPSSTPSASPHSLTANVRPYLLSGQISSQEQLEAVYKQIPSSTDQLELMQKQMLALIEQQQKLSSLGINTAGLGGGAATTVPGSDRVQVPLLWFGMPGLTTPFQFPTTTTTSSSITNPIPSPTPPTTASDTGLSSLPQIPVLSTLPLQTSQSTLSGAREPLSLAGQQRRPLSESQSAPGFQSVPDSQFEVLQKQFQLQQQQLLMQSQQINNHYQEQQQRLLQQAMLERKQFEEQQRQLSAVHVRQQTELQKKQQLLRQMQEAQQINMQRQQQVLLLQSLQQQQQQRQLSQLQQQITPPITVPHPQSSPQP